jgi:lysine 2,3-aminomutase
VKERITPFLRQQLHDPVIAGQYQQSPSAPDSGFNDPLLEEKHEMVRGLVHKYHNRALIKVSWLCAAHCRFCTRIRQIGNPAGTLEAGDIDQIANYLHAHPEIDDVILSGGDPFFTPVLSKSVLEMLQPIASVKVLRIGTRMPFQAPEAFLQNGVLKLLETVRKLAEQRPFYILLHIEHPHELTPETEQVIAMLRQLPVSLLSQTVFLRGINDDIDTLETLFRRLYHLGVIPYYLYRCDAVHGLESYRCDPEQEKQIARELRNRLSGIACPLFVDDQENGYGKLPVF